MGINRQALALLFHEHLYRPIVGDFVALGKQTVNIEPHVILELCARFGIPVDRVARSLAETKGDSQTRRGAGGILDHELLQSFSDARYRCLDVSPYEGADIIQDMNRPLAAELEGIADFIYDGSCMDNAFDPVSFITNCNKMLRVGGRIIHIECAAAEAGAYLSFSPEWFYSYYAINMFADCKAYVYVARQPETRRGEFVADVFEWKPHFTRNSSYSYIRGTQSVGGLMYIMIVAEKAEESTSNRVPTQMHYIESSRSDDWRRRTPVFEQSKRPILQWGDRDENVVLPLLTDHFVYIGSRF